MKEKNTLVDVLVGVLFLGVIFFNIAIVGLIVWIVAHFVSKWW